MAKVTVSPSSAAAALLASAATTALALWWRHLRQEREDEEEIIDEEALPSIIEQFRSFVLDSGTTVEEANKRRTTNYYEKARLAHNYRIIPACSSSIILQKRQAYLGNMLKYYIEGKKSHRTIVIMCDETTASLLYKVRQDILHPLQPSNDISTEGCWIPDLCIMPQEDMHVTVAIPWWWHTMSEPEANQQLTQDLAARFRQALVLEMHFAFQIELERIILLGGQTLVALWRCIGERQAISAEGEKHTIYDRHGDMDDPFVRLRREIVRCFSRGASDIGLKPLTYFHHNKRGNNSSKETKKPTESLDRGASSRKLEETHQSIPSRPILKRQNTIELKTPGIGDRDGFIHTTLCRLPIDCMTSKSVNLDQVHRLCREATATLCGHRMVVSNYRFLETTGCGGELQSNPCVEPIYDERIAAPARFAVTVDGGIAETDLHTMKIVDGNATIGAIPTKVEHEPLMNLFNRTDSE